MLYFTKYIDNENIEDLGIEDISPNLHIYKQSKLKFYFKVKGSKLILKKNKEYEFSPEKYFYLNENLKLSLITGDKSEVTHFLEAKKISSDDFEAYYQAYEFEQSRKMNSNQLENIREQPEINEKERIIQLEVELEHTEPKKLEEGFSNIREQENLVITDKVDEVESDAAKSSDKELVQEVLNEMNEIEKDELLLEMASPSQNFHINEEINLENISYPKHMNSENEITFCFQENPNSQLNEKIESFVDNSEKINDLVINTLDDKKDNTYDFMEQINENNFEDIYEHQEILPDNKEEVLETEKLELINNQEIKNDKDNIEEEIISFKEEEQEDLSKTENDENNKDIEMTMDNNHNNHTDIQTNTHIETNTYIQTINNQLYDSGLIEQKLKDTGIINNADFSKKESLSTPILTPTAKTKKSSKKLVKAKDMLQNKRNRDDVEKTNIMDTEKELQITPNKKIEMQQKINITSNISPNILPKGNKKLTTAETPIIINKDIPEVKKSSKTKEKETPQVAKVTPTQNPPENISSPDTKTKLIFVEYSIDGRIKKKLKSINCEVEQDEWDVLITEKLSKNTKILMAINNRKPILSPNWLLDSLEKKKLMPYDAYFIKDKDYEKKYNFDFSSLMKDAPYASYMEEYSFHVTDGVFNKDDIEEIINSAGGEIFQSYKGKKNKNKFFIIADKVQDKEEIKLLKSTGAYQLYSSDFITESVYTQSLEMKNKYKL